MRDFTLFISLLLFLLSCNKKKYQSEVDVYFEKRDQYILNSQKLNNNNDSKLLLDFRINISKIEFDSILWTHVFEDRIIFKNDTTHLLVVPSFKSNLVNNHFEITPFFVNDSLKTIRLLATNNPNTNFYDLKTTLSSLYGSPLGSYVNFSKITSSSTKYSYWIDNGIFINLSEDSYKPDNENPNGLNFLMLYYSDIEDRKKNIKKHQIKKIKEEENLRQSREKEDARLKKLKNETDSIVNSIF